MGSKGGAFREGACRVNLSSSVVGEYFCLSEVSLLLGCGQCLEARDVLFCGADGEVPRVWTPLTLCVLNAACPACPDPGCRLVFFEMGPLLQFTILCLSALSSYLDWYDVNLT